MGLAVNLTLVSATRMCLTPGGDFETIPGRLVGEDREVEIVVVGGEEDILPVVTPLGYVMRESGDDYSWDPWHE